LGVELKEAGRERTGTRRKVQTVSTLWRETELLGSSTHDAKKRTKEKRERLFSKSVEPSGKGIWGKDINKKSERG